MNLMELAIKVGVEDETQGALDSISSGTIARGVAIGNAMWDMTKQVASAAGGAVRELVGGALDAYSNYEQLSGGVAKLYGNAGQSVEEYAAAQGKAVDEVIGDWQRNEDAQALVMDNAAKAYKTAGMSANDYMEQATSFSAALISSLGGDTQRAAEMTDVAMRAMSDNVNTFGSNAEDVSNAFNGFAKQNYTMLDNLKLGYGGTKTEMERLIADANEWGAANGEASDLSIDSFADVVQAIQQIQEKQQIAGTTAHEAATTIEGSITMMRGAWENWIAGLGDSDADMGQLTDDLLGAVSSVVENVAPRLALIATTIVTELPGAVAKAVQSLPGLVGPIADSLRQSLQEGLGIDAGPAEEALSAIGGAGAALADALGSIDLTGLFDGVSQGAQNFLSFLGPCGEILRSVFSDPTVQEALQVLADTLGALAEVAGTVLGAALEALVYLFGLLVTTIATVVTDVAGLVTSIVTFFTVDVPGAMDALVSLLSELPARVGEFLASVVASVAGFVTSLASGASSAGSQFLTNVVSFLSQLPGQVAGLLAGIVSNVLSWVGSMASGASSAGSQFLTNVVSFLSQLPGRVAAFLASVVSSVLSWVGSMASGASSAGSQFLQNVVSFVTQLPGRVASLLQQAVSSVARWASDMGSKAREAGQNFLSSVKDGLNGAVDFVRGIPNKIVNALGNLGRLLWNAGTSIMSGLRDGIVSGFQSVLNRVKSMASEIAALKGPIPYDRVVLTPNGEALMAGLLGGLSEGFEGEVLPYVSAMAAEMADAVSEVPASVSLSPAAGATEGGTGAAPQVTGLDEVTSLLRQILDRGTDVYMDGRKVSAALAAGARTQLVGRGLA